MNVSLDGLFAGVETSLRSSQSDMACLYAYSLMEFAENLRKVKKGDATLDDLFEVYKLQTDGHETLTKRVDKRYYDCMRDESEDTDVDVE